jgi:hypothetical protein
MLHWSFAGETGMDGRWIGSALVLSLAMMTLTAPLSAQQRPSAAPTLQPDPHLDSEDQLAPSQIAQPMPGAVPGPSGPPTHPAPHPARPAATEAVTAPGAGKPVKLVVACSGPFSKDSSNLRLAMTFDSRNVTFEDVDFDGSKVGASILYQNDPKKRLEIWWSNPANRSGTYLILINKASAWVAPGGLRLHLTLAELQKLNHKPFKLKGFDKDNVASVSDWDGGALATITGGCKSGVSLQADPKAGADAVTALSADHEYASDDPAMRAVKPTVSEILIGY